MHCPRRIVDNTVVALDPALALLRGGSAGISAWNRLRAHGAQPPSLHEQDLRGLDLADADLSHTCLAGARLDGADLTGARLAGSDLPWASLRGARLDGADLDGADFSRADLRGASLDGARLVGADLSAAETVGDDHARLARLVALTG